ncbi:MAG: RNA methyltransferase [Spirochaetaceae bacterium]|nr:RNA methyltransferase [Spirochaetaceae bacterium]
MRLDDITIVLSRPSEPGNAGAVCRGMKNMGLRRLRTVAAELDLQEGGRETLLARAIHAADVWEQAEHFATLEAALADCAISVGTTRRRGRRRKLSTLSPRELAEFLKARTGRAALVFGNERTGLNGEELALCNMASHISVSRECPSINLSHAVQIYTYELYRAMAETGAPRGVDMSGGLGGKTGPLEVPGQWVPMAKNEIDILVTGISTALASIGFYRRPGRTRQERFLRDLIARAGLSLNEGRYLKTIIVKAGRLGALQPGIYPDPKENPAGAFLT